MGCLLAGGQRSWVFVLGCVSCAFRFVSHVFGMVYSVLIGVQEGTINKPVSHLMLAHAVAAPHKVTTAQAR